MTNLKEELKFEQDKFNIKKKFVELEHKIKMERLEFERESVKIFHELALERQRIKTAEIRRSQMRKYSEDPYKN